MTPLLRIQAIAAGLLVLIGLLLIVLPGDWIELGFGTDPDAGNGMVESWLAGILLAVGSALGIVALVGHRRLRQAREATLLSR